MRDRNPIPLLRTIALVEGASFLVLVLIAMPLKYAGGIAEPVKVVGWAHGILFVALCAALAWSAIVARWSIGRSALVLLAALLPFGPFVIDGRMKRYAEEFRSSLGAQQKQQISGSRA